MSNFIEELFYCNIGPQAYAVKTNKKIRREARILTYNEDILLKNLSGENQRLFQEYIDT